MGNQFQVEILEDGTIKCTSPGGFDRETHADADRFVDMLKQLGGGEVQTKRLQPHLGNPHAQAHGQQQQHRH